MALDALRSSLAVGISHITQRALCQFNDTHDLRSGDSLTFMYNSYWVDAMTPSILSTAIVLFRNVLRRDGVRRANESTGQTSQRSSSQHPVIGGS